MGLGRKCGLKAAEDVAAWLGVAAMRTERPFVLQSRRAANIQDASNMPSPADYVCVHT